MDLNELVVEQIINSERKKISNGFNKKLETALKEEQQKINIKIRENQRNSKITHEDKRTSNKSKNTSDNQKTTKKINTRRI